MCQAETWRFGFYFLNLILKHLTFPRPFRYSVYNARLIYCLMLRNKFGLWATSMGKQGQAWTITDCSWLQVVVELDPYAQWPVFRLSANMDLLHPRSSPAYGGGAFSPTSMNQVNTIGYQSFNMGLVLTLV